MRSDIRQAVGRHREEPFPRALDADVGEDGNSSSKYSRSVPRRRRELRRAPRARLDRTIRAAEQQPAIRRPAHVVIRPRGIPQHHVAEAKPRRVRRRSDWSPARRCGAS